MVAASCVGLQSKLDFVRQAYGDTVTRLNPVAYWHLGEAEGTTMIDERAVRNGEYFGSVELGRTSLVSNSAGTAAGFNGIDSYGKVAHHPAFALASYTLDLAFRVAAAPGVGSNQVLLSKEAFPSPLGGVSIEIYNHGGQLRLRAYLVDLSGPVWIGAEEGVADLALNTAYKVTLTSDVVAGAKLYLDGVEVASKPGITVGLIANPQPFVFGAWSDAALAKFDGTLDEVALFGRALLADQVALLAQAYTPPPPAFVQLAAPLEMFTPAVVRLTALAGWPAGRMPRQVSAQGDLVRGYLRRSWKAANNDGTWMDFWPGAKPTPAGQTTVVSLELDDGSALDVRAEVRATIPAPAGSGQVRHLDSAAASGGNGTSASPWNDWRTAIQSLAAGDVLVIRAPAGSRTINGRSIPFSTYPIDVSSGGSATSTVDAVTIFADPSDLAAGRRPRVHINGTELAGFFDDPNGMWEPDPGDPAGNVWRTVSSSFSAPIQSVNAWYRGSTGRVVGLYDYYHPQQGAYLNQIRDTAYSKFNAYAQARRQIYAGPGVTYSGGRYYVRLSPPHPSTICKGSAPNPPWYWGHYYPPSTNPNQVPIYFATTAGTTNANSCLRINNRSGWKIYNIDFVPSGYGIEANSSSNLQVYGCRFFGNCHLEHIDQDNTNFQGRALRAEFANNLLVDRCEFYGGSPPWHTWSEGKGWCGAWGPSIRNAAISGQQSTFTARHCHFEGYYHLLFLDGQNPNHPKSPKFHHCTMLNCGAMDGLFVFVVPDSTVELIRNKMLNCTLAGWAGSNGSFGAGDMHVVANLEVRVVPGYASQRAYGTTSIDCDYMPNNTIITHGSIGDAGEPGPQFRCQNTIIGTQRHRPAFTSPSNVGDGCGVGPARPSGVTERSKHYWAHNNIAAVFPSANGYPWNTTDGTIGAPLDSHASYILQHEPWSHTDYNHYYRDSAMPNSGRTGLVTVVNWNSSVVSYDTIQNVKSNSMLEAHGTGGKGPTGNPGFAGTPTYPSAVPEDGVLYDPQIYQIGLGTACAGGGNTGLAAQGGHDYDGNTPITYPGYAWRGCYVPGVPAIEQDVGPLGPSVSGSTA